MTTTLNTVWVDNGQDMTDDAGVVRAIIRYIPDRAPRGAWAVALQDTHGGLHNCLRFDCLEAAQYQAFSWEANRLSRMSRGSGPAPVTSLLAAAVAAVDQAVEDMARAREGLARLSQEGLDSRPREI